MLVFNTTTDLLVCVCVYLLSIQRVALLSTDQDYLKVQELFCKTLSGFDIISIERIQNKELWEDFQT